MGSAFIIFIIPVPKTPHLYLKLHQVILFGTIKCSHFLESFFSLTYSFLLRGLNTAWCGIRSWYRFIGSHFNIFFSVYSRFNWNFIGFLCFSKVKRFSDFFSQFSWIWENKINCKSLMWAWILIKASLKRITSFSKF